MKEYKFVKTDVSFFSGTVKKNYKEIVEQHAQEGWRLVQILCIPTGDFEIRAVDSIEIIFERDK